MSRARKPTNLKPPFLQRLETLYDLIPNFDSYPFSIPVVKSRNLTIDFKKRVTILVGDNGVGKSTILEAIAANCGFSLIGGSRNHTIYNSEKELLSKYLRLGWKPKITRGFFLRAETFFSFIQSIDSLASETGTDLYHAYGGRSLRERSHGESFLALFENRFGNQGIYILDEPEAALSPQRQVEFLKLIRKMDRSESCQLIISTHSILLMAYPNAQLLRVTNQGIKPVEFHDMPHFKILRDFCLDPDAFLAGVFFDADEKERSAMP